MLSATPWTHTMVSRLVLVLLSGLLCPLVVVHGMGVLTVGRPLPWATSLPHLQYVRQHGVQQFIHKYNSVKNLTNTELLWGDELEYSIVGLDHANRKPRIMLKAAEVREQLNLKEKSPDSHFAEGCTWMPEYGSWMVEGTPNRPYSGYTNDLLRVERNMRLRRARMLAALGPDETALTLTVFPRLGCDDFCDPPAPTRGPIAESEFIPDECINPHPRFGALTRNIRMRRGSNVDIRVPLFLDEATPEFTAGASADPYISMDAMAFGMGCCCMQVTFQARDIDESRYMFDQLVVLSPLFLALTAATPIMRGRLADTDVRWSTIAASVDDRTRAERSRASEASGAAADERMAGGGVQPLHKSRYDSVSGYIYNCPHIPDMVARFNDVDRVMDQWSLDTLRAAGVDEVLSQHIAHLFVRDPLVIFEGRIDELDDREDTDHFENLQSTNWQTVRWKPPPPRTGPNAPQIGWRTEFRPMEVQITDFENAAFAVFVVLLTRVILAFDLNLYIPMSLVEANMRRAHCRDAVTTQKFYFRKNIAPPQRNARPDADACLEEQEECGACFGVGGEDEGLDEVVEMTVEEIFCGKGSFSGLIPLVQAYLEHIRCAPEVQAQVQKYLDLVAARASGASPTAARWIRDFVTSHAEYQHDSVVSDSIAYDLVNKVRNVAEGREPAEDLLGEGVKIRALSADMAYDIPLSSLRISDRQSREMIEAIMKRASHRTVNRTPTEMADRDDEASS